MSVRTDKREQSKTEFLRLVSDMACDSLYLVTRLSNKMKRVVGDSICITANKIMANLHAANQVKIEDQITFNLRRYKFKEALADLSALDAQLNLAYSVLRRNPQGAYHSETGKTVRPSEALEKIDSRISVIIEQKSQIERIVKAILKQENQQYPGYFAANTL